MSIVTMPASPAPSEIEWKLRQPSQVNRGEFTGLRRVTILTAAPSWAASVKLPLIVGEQGVLPWRAFFAQLQGRANRFRLRACERRQITGVAPLINGGGQGGFTLATDNWGSAGLKLRAGNFVTVNDQLLQLTDDVVANDGGAATLRFMPYLRYAAADNAAIEVELPYALMSLTDDEAGWKVSPGQQYEIAFACEESF